MSVIDVSSIVSQLMAVERQPLQKFALKDAAIQAKISAYGGVKSALASFQTAAQAFANADSFNVVTASSSNTDFVGITASKSAAINSFAVDVAQLAQNQKLASSSYVSLTSPVGEGTMTIDFGKYTSDSGSTTFTNNPDKTSATITIDSSNNTLSGLRDAINNAKAGVSASIVNDGSGYKLTITSNDTGESNALRITTDDTGDGNNTDTAGLSSLAYNASTVGGVKNLAEKQVAQNALLKIDGIDISKPTNVVSDAVDGVTLTLNKVTTSAISMNVSKNTGSIKTSVQAFVKAYNALSKTLTDATSYNTETKQAALLNGDPTIRSIQYSIRNAMIQNVDGTGGDIRSLTQVGLKIDEKGVMSLDSSKFDSAVASDPQAVVGLFASNARASDSMIRIDSYDKNGSSTADLGISVINNATQATFTSSALTFASGKFTVDSSNKTFSINVNGNAASVTLTAGDYTPAQLAAELQTRINSNSTLQSAGAKVNVAIGSDNKITINNAKYGSAGSLNITSDLLGGGLSAAESKGLDVKVRIGNDIKTGVGQQVSLDNGLKFTVLGGAASDPDGADRGAIDISNGMGARLDALLTKVLSNTGAIATKINSMNSQSKTISKQTDDFNRRLEDIEKRYRTQYTNLDVSVSQMQNTSTWLSTQLANLPKISS